MRILIVDDVESNRCVLELMLRPLGECELCASGEEALQRIVTALEAQAPYGLVVLDVGMPGLSGEETLGALRNEERRRNVSLKQRTKVLVVSSNDDPMIMKRCLAEGDAAYLVKPLFKEALSAKLRLLGIETAAS